MGSAVLQSERVVTMAAIPAYGEDNKVEMTFRTRKRELKISPWSWLDEEGKPTGRRKND